MPSLLLIAPAQAEGPVVGADAPGAVPGRYIVTTEDGRTTTVRLSARDARRRAADPKVRMVEQDRRIRIAATQRDPVWNLDRIDQRAGTPSRTYTPMDDGSAAHAYVIDTGIKISHRQFGGRASYGYDFAGDDRFADDCAGHGTHVAGILGGSTYGVAKRVKLVAVRVLDCAGEGFVSDAIDGVEWVTENAVKPAVANMSLGAAYSPSLEFAVRNSIASGVTYVVAAGNENADAGSVSPAGVSAAITVAASDAEDRRAWFSNWGSTVDLFAPGVGIRSAYKGSATATAVLSGTSMASPHVAGAAALVLDAYPSYTPAQVRAYLVGRATTGRIAGRKGAPNRLLYVPAPPPAPRIATSVLPAGQVGVPYRAQLTLVTGRRGAWSVAAGTLPDGLTLSRAGLVSGTPTTPTPTRRITVKFTDYVPQSVTRNLYVLVRG
ncbi:MAG TPA: S8 family peptidase [Actinoplanes sp.]|nr:S8 family peptidase [Actinoplanes sp.]